MSKKLLSMFLSLQMLLGTFIIFSNLNYAFVNNIKYYYWDAKPNVGDRLTEDLLDYLNISGIYTKKRQSEFFFIGSILNTTLPEKLKIFGSGFISEPKENMKIPKKIDIKCLRGKKMKRFM